MIVDKPRINLDGGTGDCHLYIINAPDNRSEIVNKICEVSIGSFSSITVLNKDPYFKCDHPVVRVEHIVVPSKIQHAYVRAIELTRIGDYISLLDSDEVPGRDLLKFIRNKRYLKFADTVDSFGIRVIPHFYDEINNSLYTDKSEWRKTILVKRTERSIVPSMGVHSSISNENCLYYPIDSKILAMHCKTQSQISFSALAYSMRDFTHHTAEQNSPNHQIVQTFINKYNINVEDDLQLCALVNNKDRMIELNDMLDHSINESIAIHAKKWVADYGKVIPYNFASCKEKCCVHLQ
jgi:hypothetical protein